MGIFLEVHFCFKKCEEPAPKYSKGMTEFTPISLKPFLAHLIEDFDSFAL